ncbi:MAG: gliding motility-associated C-terminal domain-containing protein [Saprospiraceae bacterium]
MKTVSYLKKLFTISIVLISNYLAGQSLLPPGPVVIEPECEGDEDFVESRTLSAQPDTFIINNFNIISYQWTGPANTQLGTGDTYVATETGVYLLTVNALRLRDSVRVTLSDTIQVIFDANCCEARIPNAFTPNGDNKNDIFAPVLPTHCVFQDYQLQVFNRWGQKVFDTQLMNVPLTPETVVGWDGKVDGKDAPSDVYVYWMRYTATGNNNTYPSSTKKGNITLIR